MSFPETMTPKDIAWSATAVLQALLGGPAATAFVSQDPLDPSKIRVRIDIAIDNAFSLAEQIHSRADKLCTMHPAIRPDAELDAVIQSALGRQAIRAARKAREKKGPHEPAP